MAFDAATIIRAGTSSLVILVGLFIMLVGRRKSGVLLLGLLFVLAGLLTLMNNLWRGASDARLIAVTVMSIALAGSAFAAAIAFPDRPRQRGEWLACLYGTVVGAAVVLGLGDGVHAYYQFVDPTGNASRYLPLARVAATVSYVAGGAFPAIAGARTAFAAPRAGGVSNRVALTASLGIWWSFQVVVLTDQPFGPWAFAGSVAFAAGMAIPWLVAAARTGRRSPAATALLWPAISLTALLYAALPVNAEARFHDAWGLVGVARLVGWAVFVNAILRHDLLGVPLPHVAMKRGWIGAGALVSLFIVAQIAQNFFSAEFGLLTGGVVAGTFLFAANPVQKAIERMGERGPSSLSHATSATQDLHRSAGPQQEAAFRDAVRMAYRDRRFDDQEELALMRLADVIGLPAERAVAIRQEVMRGRRAQ